MNVVKIARTELRESTHVSRYNLERETGEKNFLSLQKNCSIRSSWYVTKYVT